MSTTTLRTVSALSLLAALAGYGTLAQAEQVQARVISTSPVTESNGSIRYNVTYEYAGRQYNTRVGNPPGASIWVDSSAYGVATPSPVAAQSPSSQWAAGPVDAQPQGQQQQEQQQQQAWNNVVPEPGMVVSGRGTPAPAPLYAQPAQMYAPAPVYVQPAPVYYGAPAYYPAPAYAYPPIGISLGFGYSRGWGGGGYGRWR